MNINENEYNRLLESIFNRFPSFQRVGGMAYKPGLERMESIANLLGNPQDKFRSIHIAGTNGKGSTSHILASVLIECGLKVGLYTSPHLWDFRERIKVSAGASGSAMQMIEKEYVYNFLMQNMAKFEELQASFFEITTAMAFSYFHHCKVDVAVIECGLGGRLDSTNIIVPQLSIITNIGKDHCEYLGYELHQIAAEKAGIIKEGVPAIIGEATEEGVCRVFRERAQACNSPIHFSNSASPQEWLALYLKNLSPASSPDAAELSAFLQQLVSRMDLRGSYQQKNLRAVLAALSQLALNPYFAEALRRGTLAAKLAATPFAKGIEEASRITGLHGRWEHLVADSEGRLHFASSSAEAGYQVEIICDTGHNAHGFAQTGAQIAALAAGTDFPRRLIMIFGCVADKDLDSVIPLLPNEYAPGYKAYYLFVNASGSRAMPSQTLAKRVLAAGFSGEAIVAENSVMPAFEHYLAKLYRPGDLLFIGGSSYVVASLKIENAQ